MLIFKSLLIPSVYFRFIPGNSGFHFSLFRLQNVVVDLSGLSRQDSTERRIPKCRGPVLPLLNESGQPGVLPDEAHHGHGRPEDAEERAAAGPSAWNLWAHTVSGGSLVHDSPCKFHSVVDTRICYCHPPRK